MTSTKASLHTHCHTCVSKDVQHWAVVTTPLTMLSFFSNIISVLQDAGSSSASTALRVNIPEVSFPETATRSHPFNSEANMSVRRRRREKKQPVNHRPLKLLNLRLLSKYFVVRCIKVSKQVLK